MAGRHRHEAATSKDVGAYIVEQRCACGYVRYVALRPLTERTSKPRRNPVYVGRWVRGA